MKKTMAMFLLTISILLGVGVSAGSYYAKTKWDPFGAEYGFKNKSTSYFYGKEIRSDTMDGYVSQKIGIETTRTANASATAGLGYGPLSVGAGFSLGVEYKYSEEYTIVIQDGVRKDVTWTQKVKKVSFEVWELDVWNDDYEGTAVTYNIAGIYLDQVVV